MVYIMAHEYGHHIQYCRGDADYNEEEAKRFAKEAMSKWPDFEPLDKKELFDECFYFCKSFFYTKTKYFK